MAAERVGLVSSQAKTVEVYSQKVMSGVRTRGHGTTPLRVKEDIEDVSSDLGNEGLRLHFLDETSRIIALDELRSNKTNSRFMTTINMLKRE
ncbi:hypothetical protein TNCV_4496121 [Trichonephila clavipes]|nr:hypothetical protein TNCV_4496121 [Trichonephila clavipes]